MAQSLLKVPILLGTAAAVHGLMTPPNPPAAENERVKAEGFEKVFQHLIHVVPWAAKTVFWVTSIAESAVIVASEYPSHPISERLLSFLTGYDHPRLALLRITPVFLLGSALTIAGALFRIASFRAMGKHFTYELSVKKDHRLITDYPYSVVRHPGYTGSMVAAAGMNLTLFGAEGTFIRDILGARLGLSALADHPKIAVAVMVGIGTAQALIVTALMARVPKEDEMMRKEFGKEWDDWAKRVPYKLIPGIY